MDDIAVVCLKITDMPVSKVKLSMLKNVFSIIIWVYFNCLNNGPP